MDARAAGYGLGGVHQPRLLPHEPSRRVRAAERHIPADDCSRGSQCLTGRQPADRRQGKQSPGPIGHFQLHQLAQ